MLGRHEFVRVVSLQVQNGKSQLTDQGQSTAEGPGEDP